MVSWLISPARDMTCWLLASNAGRILSREDIFERLRVALNTTVRTVQLTCVFPVSVQKLVMTQKIQNVLRLCEARLFIRQRNQRDINPFLAEL